MGSNSNCDPFDLVEYDLIVRPIIELRRDAFACCHDLNSPAAIATPRRDVDAVEECPLDRHQRRRLAALDVGARKTRDSRNLRFSRKSRMDSAQKKRLRGHD